MPLPKPKKHSTPNQHGHIHLLIPIIVILIIAAIGTLLYQHSKAASITNADYFQSGVSGKCLDDWHDGTTEGTVVDSYVCNKTAAQQWTINSNGTIENANGKCLDNWKQSSTNGNAIKIYDCSATDKAQQWVLTGSVLKNPQTGKCIDDPAFSTTDGKPLELYTCNGGSNQKWTAVAASTTSTTPPPTTTTPPPTTSSNSGFITTSGTNMMLSGKVFKFIGFDFIPVGDCWSGTNMTTAQMDTFFSLLPKNSVARFTAPQDPTDSPALVESVVAAADKYGQHVIITLNDTNSDNQCDPLDVNSQYGSGKSVAYYTSQAQAGSQYMNWVKSVVTPLAKDPGVAVWEVANEPDHSGSTIYNGLTVAQLDTFLGNAATYVRSLDSNHLIGVAPADIGDMGGESNYETILKNMNVIDDHDYSWQNGQGEVDAEVPTLEAMSKATNKPWMMDEVGVPASLSGAGCTSSTPSWNSGAGLSTGARATYLMTKANDYFGSYGISGMDFWDYATSDSGCNYGMFSTDPMISDVQHYTIP